MKQYMHPQGPVIRLAVTTLILLFAITCGWAVNLTGAGATFPGPIYQKWFYVYAQRTRVQINYQPIGSGGGIKQLQAKTVDFGASDAPLSDEEMRTMPAPVVHIPTVAGAVVIAYNLPGVPTGLHLTPEVLAGIYLGQIKNWSDPKLTTLNPRLKLPHLPITVARRSDGSGTTYIFTHYLAAVSPEWAKRVGSGKSVDWPVGMGGSGNAGVAGLVQQNPGGIGYIELAYAVQSKFAYASLRNKAGNFIVPSIASTTAAAAGAVASMKKDVRVSIVNSSNKSAYPIAGFTYILLYQNQPDKAKGKEIVNFLRWAMKDGQSFTGPLLYAPLPASVVKINEATLNSIH